MYKIFIKIYNNIQFLNIFFRSPCISCLEVLFLFKKNDSMNLKIFIPMLSFDKFKGLTYIDIELFKLARIISVNKRSPIIII